MSQNTETPEKSDQVKTAERFMEKLTEIDLTPAKEFINDFMAVADVPPKNIPEPVFREIFMPFFLGEQIEHNQDDLLAHWIGLVGSASDPANVVDIQGNTLFQVPPVCDTSQIDVMSRDPSADNFNKVFENFADEMKVHPALGARYLAEQLSKKLDTNLHGAHAAPSKYSWKPVLEYYHLVPNETAVKASQAAASDDDFNFE